MDLKLLCIGIFCLFLVSSCKPVEEELSPLEKFKEIQTQIEQTWMDYHTAYEKEDIDSVMSFFTERCIIMPDYGITIKGKKELEESFSEFFTKNNVAVTNRVSTEFMVHRDDIFEIGEIEQLIITDKEDTVAARSRYIIGFQKQEDDSWKIHRWLNQPEW